jgi:hypothetical protein
LSDALKRKLASLLPSIIRNGHAELYRQYSKANSLDAERQDADKMAGEPTTQSPGMNAPNNLNPTTLGLFNNSILPDMNTMSMLSIQSTHDQTQFSNTGFVTHEPSGTSNIPTDFASWLGNLEGSMGNVPSPSECEPAGECVDLAFMEYIDTSGELSKEN